MTNKEKITGREAILELLGFIAFQVPIEKQEEWKEMLSAFQQDIETLEMLLSCFKSAILDATNPSYRRGDNIIADLLRDQLGLIKLNELKRYLKNE